jgi:hypothetical protein
VSFLQQALKWIFGECLPGEHFLLASLNPSVGIGVGLYFCAGDRDYSFQIAVYRIEECRKWQTAI